MLLSDATAQTCRCGRWQVGDIETCILGDYFFLKYLFAQKGSFFELYTPFIFSLYFLFTGFAFRVVNA